VRQSGVRRCRRASAAGIGEHSPQPQTGASMSTQTSNCSHSRLARFIA
jgi:hypothetical protein